MNEAPTPRLADFRKILKDTGNAVKNFDQDVRNKDLLGFKNAGLNVRQVAEKFKPKKPETTTGYEVDRMIISLGELDVQKSRASDPADVRRRTEAYDRLMEKIFNSMGGTISRGAIQEEAILLEMYDVAKATAEAVSYNDGPTQANEKEIAIVDRIHARREALRHSRHSAMLEKGKSPIAKAMEGNPDFVNFRKTGRLPVEAIRPGRFSRSF